MPPSATPVTLPFSTGSGSWVMNRLPAALPVMNSNMAPKASLLNATSRWSRPSRMTFLAPRSSEES